ncbi:syntaxin-11-like isoform X2 [Brienomyrus brachyistius]|nr:syntaxin-11-like isoform X2 [Brienomyrus brachyistius]XP_048842456.1 syntaxin-11-like isoform X2 [Brienomyrus brachyistius]
MRDRLCELRRISPESSESEEEVYTFCMGPETLGQEATPFADKEHALKDVFGEVQFMQREIALLRMDARRLAKQNGRFLTSFRRISSIKRGSSAIAQGIKVKGEALYRRLRWMGGLSLELEEKMGANSAIVRIVRCQHASLTSSFREALLHYNSAEATLREHCKTRIQRQADILGQKVTGEEVDEMIETGKWSSFFARGIRTSRSALVKMEDRHRELLDLESRLRDVRELFTQVALLVEEQGGFLENIEANVLGTQDYLGATNVRLNRAMRYRKKNPCRRCFRCFSCLTA